MRALTSDEIRQRAEELAQVVIQIQERKGELKLVTGQYRTQIAALEERRNDLALAITTGQEDESQMDLDLEARR
jgi:hypothetical protein